MKGKIKERKILVEGLESNFKIAGTGPAVLILHGWGGSSDSWLGIQKKLAQQGYQVICPDFPGFGKSKTPSVPWSLSDYTTWVLNFANLLNLDKFYLIGHSFGGRVAISFVARYPERVKRLILCNSAGIKTSVSREVKTIQFLAKKGNSVFSHKYLRVFKDFFRFLFYLIFMRGKDYALAKGVMKETMNKVLEEDLFPLLSRIKVNTSIIWGDRDKIVPVEMARIFNENILNSRLTILEKVGHSPHLEAPEKLLKAIISNLIS